MKTCITAPEPIEATIGGKPDHVVAAAIDERGVIYLIGAKQADGNYGISNPSPTILAFIARAEAELLPPKLRGCGELTWEDLMDLRPSSMTENFWHGYVDAWATERNIKLPEAG